MTGNIVDRLRQSAGTLAAAQKAHQDNAAGKVAQAYDERDRAAQAPSGGGDGRG